MARKPIEVEDKYGRDEEAKWISHRWVTLNSQRMPKIEAWKELRNYIFATDTRSTSNAKLPWKNSTTLPKLCQIRDNLHSNYISALFPNDEWLKWEAYSKNDATKTKVVAIESYMSNKTREGHFRTEVSKLVYDYIDYGNCFATVDYESSYNEREDGERIIDFIGPRIRRISPLDIVFNATATTFKESFKIIRSLKSIGELKEMADHEPDNIYMKMAISKRDHLTNPSNAQGLEDLGKAEGMMVDGFGSFEEYIQSGFVEVLEFWGDIHNRATGTLSKGRVITVIDRMYVVRNEAIPTWMGHAPIYHAGWRKRPDNLWAMGPLDNLVGMQYRIDHLENLKADAMDLAVLPPLKIIGEVEEFVYGPGAEIHLDENGDVQELAKNAQWVIQANNEIMFLTQLMEQYAGAPSEAMGIRTPGEKTAFEVQQLQNASGRIFQEKVTTFEIEVLEPSLNAMLEVARRNMDKTDVVRVLDDDLGVVQFIEITKEDITASGKLRPIGARHYASQAQLVQNLNGLFTTQIGQMVAPHTSSKQLSKLVEDILGLQRYQLFQPNVAVFEQQETARAANQVQEDLMVEQSVTPEGIVQ